MNLLEDISFGKVYGNAYSRLWSRMRHSRPVNRD